MSVLKVMVYRLKNLFKNYKIGKSKSRIDLLTLTGLNDMLASNQEIVGFELD